jgi:glycosyltransferase involved in cell wall biosynthesis
LDVSAVPERPAGAGRYVVELVRSLAGSEELVLELLCRRADGRRWRLANPSARIHEIIPNPRPARLAYEATLLRRRIAALGVSVHHGPHYTLPRGCPVPTVVTIHDLTFFDHPEHHEAIKVRFFQSAIRAAARNAMVIVCVSGRTAERFQARFETKAPVLVAPHGIDHQRFAPTERAPGSDRAIVERLGLEPTRPRIIQVGTLEPRKGISTLLSAFEQLSASEPDCELVYVGQRGWGIEAFDRELAASPVRERVKVLGYVEDEDLPALLRSGSVLAYPSVDEGFGLPALEGLACAVPVVTTRGSVMEELCGAAAWLVEAGDPSQLAEALLEVLNAPEALRTERAAQGRARAGEFTWAKTAQRHVAAYELAASLRRA